MRSRVLTWLFAVLLLGMQQGAQWHAIAHISDTLQRPHEQGWQLPAGEAPCAVCALFASGSAAIPEARVAFHGPAADFTAPQHATLSRAVASPHYYLSRAPPALL